MRGCQAPMTTTREGVQSTLHAGASNARGIAAMLCSMACFVTSDTLIKIVGRDMPVGEIMFARGSFAVIIVGVMLLAQGGLPQIKPAFTPIVAWRTFVEVGSTVFFFTGLMRLHSPMRQPSVNSRHLPSPRARQCSWASPSAGGVGLRRPSASLAY